MIFEFATAGRILFGAGRSRQIPELARELGTRALLVSGKSGRAADDIAPALEGAGVATYRFHVDREPTIGMVDEATRLARADGCDLVIAIGGGSVLDAGKAVAGMLANPGGVLDYLELVGRGQPLSRPGVPFVAVPTTAGTGTEVTRNAVLDVPEHRVKASLRSVHLMARVAIIDPELTRSLPPAITATTGMDALTQLIEPFVSHTANPMTDAVCREGLRHIATSLPQAFHDGSDLAAREHMALAALLSGIALANAKLGAVHGLAGVLGGITGQAHGAICARLLPYVLETNLRALEERGDPSTLGRYREVAQILTGNAAAEPHDAVGWVRDRCVEFGVPSLGQAGLTSAEFANLIPLAQRASSMQGNPVKLTDAELHRILEAAL